MNAMRLLTCVVAVVALAGCESKLAALSDAELQDKTYACTTATDSSGTDSFGSSGYVNTA